MSSHSQDTKRENGVAMMDAKADQMFIEDTSKIGGGNDASSTESPPNQVARQQRYRSVEEKNEALAAAQAIDPGVSFRSAKGFYYILLIFCSCWAGGDQGADATILSAINGMQQFRDSFGLENSPSGTSLVFGIYTVGSLVGSFPAPYLADRFGRRFAICLGNLLLMVGAIITANANTMSTFIGGRFLTGFAGTIANNASKPYLAEISSPKDRGWTCGLQNSFYYVGQIMASGVAIPFGRREGSIAWRAPLYFQIIPAAIAGGTIYLFPESPRYLFAQGKRDEAARVLARFHSATNDVDSPVVLLELEELDEAISMEGADKRFWDVRPLFKTRADRRRTLLGWLVSWAGQFRQAGITSQNKILTLNFVNSITSFAGALTGCAISDRVGRRFLMLFGEISACIIMAIVAALLSPAGPQSAERANAAITFIFLFMVFFSVGWTPLQGLYPTEILAFEIRAKGLAIQGLMSSAVSCINTFALPNALASIGYKTYIIFVVVDFVLTLIIYFFAVEAKQMSLEELDEIFEAENPRKYSVLLAKQHKQRAKEAQAARKAAV